MENLLILMIIPIILIALTLAITNLNLIKKLVILGLWLHWAVVIWLVKPVITGAVLNIRINEDLSFDRTDALFLILTCFIVASGLTHAKFFFDREQQDNPTIEPNTIRFLYAGALVFLLAMSAVFMCDNLGYLWIAIETTTLASAYLVYFRRTKDAIEATWKYLIICSVGIAFALLGTVLIFASSQHGAASGGSLNIHALINDGPNLQYALLRLGFIFCFLGYGTKAGMFPIHSWLPDAYSEAPSPISALMSGALVNCSLYGIWRISQILMAAHHQLLCHDLIIWAGTITVMAASLFLVRQHALKRLWAYSSIENIGLMLVAIGIGSGPLFFLQAVNHSLAKTSLFLLSGNVVQATGSNNLKDIRGIIRFAPIWALLLTLSAFAVTGAPPFGSFLSEWLILTNTTEAKEWAAAICLLISLALAFVAVCAHLGRILVGRPDNKALSFRPIATSLIPALLIGCSLLLGFTTGADILGMIK